MAARFHQDGLCMVWSFLQLSNMASVAATCRTWRDSLYSMAPSMTPPLMICHIAVQRLPFVVLSPLHRLIRSLHIYGRCSLADLSLLRHVPLLEHLDAEFSDIHEVFQGRRMMLNRILPCTITNLRLRMSDFIYKKAPHVWMAPSDVVELHCSLSSGYSYIDLTNITRLQSLTHLTLGSLTLTDDDLPMGKSLPKLYLFQIDALWIYQLDQLVHVSKQLTTLHVSSMHATDRHVDALVLLPALTALHVRSADAHVLLRLLSLVQLGFLDPSIHDVNYAWMPLALTGCAQLAHLILKDIYLQADLLNNITHVVPQLRKLTLNSCNLSDADQKMLQVRGIEVTQD
jgi:hypothetical protein